ncbi:hypothetical protein ABZ726_30695 [Streptomyces hundungensis]|uniref:hypothetical protein n=1 Tax=Streptomyces hundungensis TaxID=1077946 RepID=UPI0033E5FCDA
MVVTALLTTGVGSFTPLAQARPASQRGDLIQVEAESTRTPSQVSDFLKSAGIDNTEVRYGVRGYRITYRTITPQGTPTTATGLLVLPQDGRHTRLDLVADTHGTMVDRDYAPSVGEDDGRLSPYLHASVGRAVTAPDYLGLGKGPGRHPYMDTASAVSASLDMLRATRTAARELGRPLTGNVYGTGFSQGGQVAMALGRALSQGADAHFRLKALAPVSGPYDIVGQEMPALFDGRVNDTSGVLSMAYWLTAQNRLHPLNTHSFGYGPVPFAQFPAPLAPVVCRLRAAGGWSRSSPRPQPLSIPRTVLASRAVPRAPETPGAGQRRHTQPVRRLRTSAFRARSGSGAEPQAAPSSSAGRAWLVAQFPAP